MFKFFKRVKTVVGSELNSMLDKAEDPVKMLDQFMRDMENDIREAESAVAKQIANEKMLKRKYDDSQAIVDKRMQQAEQAIEAGNEDLARRALEDKKNHQDQADQLKASWERAQTDSSNLRQKLDEMKKEYQEMKLKKDSLKARAESAKTRTKMNRTMSNIGGDESRQGFERMEEKVMQHEAEAETSEDMSSESRSLDDEFEELNNNDSVDNELEELKKKMNKE
ncbi:phage shock protein A (PspA) family protein [Halobacillus alkaliphilus]|uniref:Phage shock protein A (PspA) family protein n=1 Tax=Halobacillus alkaliphilus TaxID=396056 RepID=A0A1I2NZI9_9BACI|nr:PspA/IM30 family protein [Halobacillus alkaliphilus]SFG09405.1 phage shock protein A (PspA) family protein [Halobacillus alkaliphilus]